MLASFLKLSFILKYNIRNYRNIILKSLVIHKAFLSQDELMIFLKVQLNMHSRGKHARGWAWSQNWSIYLLAVIQACNPSFGPTVNKGKDVLDHIYNMYFLVGGLRAVSFMLHRDSVTLADRKKKIFIEFRNET